jgi:ATP synthase mitochondrial F1 complex assembly factor 2
VAASRLEEEFQVEVWGVVEGGHDMDRLNNTVRLSSVGTFLSLYRTPAQAKLAWNQWKST